MKTNYTVVYYNKEKQVTKKRDIQAKNLQGAKMIAYGRMCANMFSDMYTTEIYESGKLVATRSYELINKWVNC